MTQGSCLFPEMAQSLSYSAKASFPASWAGWSIPIRRRSATMAGPILGRSSSCDAAAGSAGMVFFIGFFRVSSDHFQAEIFDQRRQGADGGKYRRHDGDNAAHGDTCGERDFQQAFAVGLADDQAAYIAFGHQLLYPLHQLVSGDGNFFLPAGAAFSRFMVHCVVLGFR